jgi:hypothetical protein
MCGKESGPDRYYSDQVSQLVHHFSEHNNSGTIGDVPTDSATKADHTHHLADCSLKHQPALAP